MRQGAITEEDIETELRQRRAQLAEINTTAEQGKPSPLEEFVDRCVAAALEELRKRDPAFVSRGEEQKRLEDAGLVAYRGVMETPPETRLPSAWHSLLTTCYELPEHFWNVRYLAIGLDAKAFVGLSTMDAYIRGNYHRFSLAVSLQALLEHVEQVIDCITSVYISASSRRRRKASEYRKRARSILPKIKGGRDDYLHAKPKAMAARSITERGLWEYAVIARDANGFRPSEASVRTLERSVARFRSGEWGHLKKIADHYCDLLGGVLLDLEDELVHLATS